MHFGSALTSILQALSFGKSTINDATADSNMPTHKFASEPARACFLLCFMIVWYLLAQKPDTAWDSKRSRDWMMRMVLRLSELR